MTTPDSDLDQITKHTPINNKDLLIISLLEYISTSTSTPPHILTQIYQYLQQNKIIDPTNITPNTKNIYIQFLKALFDRYSTKSLPTTNLYISRYTTDFDSFDLIKSGGFSSVYKAHNQLDNTIHHQIPIHNLRLHIQPSMNEKPRQTVPSQHRPLPYHLDRNGLRASRPLGGAGTALARRSPGRCRPAQDNRAIRADGRACRSCRPETRPSPSSGRRGPRRKPAPAWSRSDEGPS